MDALMELKKITDGPTALNVVLANPIASVAQAGCCWPSTDIFVLHDRIVTDMQKVLDERIIANE